MFDYIAVNAKWLTWFISYQSSRGSATGKVIPELGAGGGAGDLIQSHDLELEDLEDEDIAKLKALCTKKISDPEVRLKTLDIISQAIQSKRKVVSLGPLDFNTDEEDMPLAELAKRLAKLADQDDVISSKPCSKASDERQPTTARASQKKPLPRKIGGGSQELQETKRKRRFPDLTSSRQGSVESQPMEAPGMNPIDLPRSSRDPDPDPRPDVPDGSDRIAKRRRVSPPSTEIGQGEDASSNADPPSGELSPRSTLCQIRQFFEDYRGLGDRNATVPNRTAISMTPHGTTRNHGHVAKDTRNVHCGTQAKPIVLSDGGDSSTNDEDDYDGARGFLLDQMPEPDSIPDTNHATQSGPETQLSLSDAAFESQESHCAAAETAKTRAPHRKDAYDAAKELSGRWEVEHGLISSRAGHSEEELEL
ncbi:hypothetical protein OEA41_004810 [Lepraria neglecta]|uniref:Uncharacterized protein n=1 Tax=Lepraria neglecta TaxID=209136 RepID=A0AAD9Z0P2_9LECA|nr:hypothetical protein OEA41_004810 [Lepraria neglecta]